MGISQLHLTFPLLVSPLFDYICFDCVVLSFLFFHFLQLAVQLLAMRRVRVWSVDEAKLVKNKMFHKLRRISENVVIHQALRVFIVFVLFHTLRIRSFFGYTRISYWCQCAAETNNEKNKQSCQTTKNQYVADLFFGLWLLQQIGWIYGTLHLIRLDDSRIVYMNDMSWCIVGLCNKKKVCLFLFLTLVLSHSIIASLFRLCI